MTHRWKHLPKPVAAAAGSALIIAFAFGGLVAAHSTPTLPAPPASTHASATAQDAANDANAHAVEVLSNKATDSTTDSTTTETTEASHPDNQGATVSAVAQDSSLVGGPHQNHGWYVSCVAHGGTPDVTANPNTCTPPTAAPTTASTTSTTAKAHGKSGHHGQSWQHVAAPGSPAAP